MKMRTGRKAGRADAADLLAALHFLAFFHLDRVQMQINRANALAVPQQNGAAVKIEIVGEQNQSGVRRDHRIAFLTGQVHAAVIIEDRKSTRLNSSHSQISYAVFCLKKKTVRESTRRGTRG